MVFAALAANSQATIGANQTPNKDAVLELVSGNKGLLLPRVAETSRPAAPAAGLVIFNTTQNEVQYYNGQKWVSMTEKATQPTSAGNMQIRKETLTTTLNIDAADGAVICTNVAAGQVKLPAAAGLKGKTLYVKASGAGNVQVSSAGGALIDDAVTYEIPGGAKLTIMFVSDGQNWNVLN